MTTKTFGQLGIISKTLSGNKINIEDVFNKEIIVLGFRIADSHYGKKNNGNRCLYLQINYNNENRVIFTASEILMQILEEIPINEFPFKTTIIKETALDKNGKQITWYKFT